ncbi:MAG TPA: SDR family NAD(P)-dependent oxidoreductase [Burkholderiaceae bacterium]|jgi:NAD(P)-dependent dehydrogenase (short-subunit alcohol dehydrogenase family)|nr:SDR family NAD(P)-dependent oxidoreductase [Burkholderiaceae bacterium]
MHIRDNVFIVSGGASGLGAAVVRMLVEEGGRVIVADLAEEAGQTLADEFGSAARTVQCDVTSEIDVHAAVEAAQSEGPLRGLVNCAGVLAAERTVGRDHAHLLTTFERVIRVNLIGTFNMARVCAQAMSHNAALDDGERGVIVNTASIAAFEGQIGQVAYSASKGGVVAMTLPMARDLARHAIRCVAIAPGSFETPMLAALKPESHQALASQAPFPARLGRPSEFAHMVRSVIQNVMLNGTTIRLDGALRLQPK